MDPRALSAPMPAPMGEAVARPLDAWLEWADLAHVWWSRRTGVANPAPERLRELVGYARERSPLFARLLAGVPDAVRAEGLPRTTKARLMESFDAWSTDRRVKRAEVDAFLADRSRVGERFLDRYQVWKSSGTSGTTGIFVQDAHAMAVYEALVLDQYEKAPVDAIRVVRANARRALVAADGDHFASVALWRHLDRAWPGGASLVCSVLAPLADTAARLQRFQPAFLAGYPTVLTLLAEEQHAGRLALAPALVWSGGEHLGERTRRRIEEAFGCPVMNEYGASECLSIAHGCAHGWLHVNADWVLLEPVEADGRPTPPGKPSHTVLVTNLANHVQPIVRYDLGDRVSMRGAPCPCGNPMPAIRVEGRNDDILVLRGPGKHATALAPLALTTVLDDACGEHRYQLVQRGDRLALRVAAEGSAHERIGRAALADLRAFLQAQGLGNVRVALERTAPRRDAASGKLRTVMAEPCPTLPR